MNQGEMYNVDPDMQGLVIDIGHDTTKCGFSGDDAPRAVYPTVVGKVSEKGMKMKNKYGSKRFWSDLLVGDEAFAKSQQEFGEEITLFNPIPSDGNENVDYACFEKLMNHNYYIECHCSPEEHPTLLTMQRLTEETYEKVIDMQFQKYHLPALAMCDSSVLSLMSSGRMTGCVVECGESVTSSSCIYEGLPIHYSKFILEDSRNRKQSVSGKLIRNTFRKLLLDKNEYLQSENFREKGYNNYNDSPDEIVRDIHEKFSALSLEKFDSERIGSILPSYKRSYEIILETHEKYPGSYNSEKSKRTYRNLIQRRADGVYERKINDEVLKFELPSPMGEVEKQYVEIGHERYEAPEILFNPSLIGYNGCPGIHKMVNLSIQKVHPDLRDEMYQSIVLAGGSTLIDNFQERLTLELEDLLMTNNKTIRIHPPAERKFAAWIGGSIFTSLSIFDKEWITKAQYEEYGYSILRRKNQFATIDNIHQVEGVLSLLVAHSEDPDLEERRNYIIESDVQKNEFVIKFRSSESVLFVRFRSFLML